MKDECIAQIPPGSYSAFNIPIFKKNINMKRPDFSSVIQRGTFNIPWPISYHRQPLRVPLQREEKMLRRKEHVLTIF